MRISMDYNNLMEYYLIPAREARAEITVVNSRFIASAAPVFSVEEAKDFIARIKAEYLDASHNVPAYVIGHGVSTISHCNDDGEPSGTAGRPALAVLSGSGLGDVAVVVSRYFGGTKLGAGGLVRAYSDAVRAVLEILPRAKKIPTHTIMLIIPYSWVDRLRRLVEQNGGHIEDEEFAVDVTVTARFPTTAFPAFQEALTQASHGSLLAEIIDTQIAIVEFS
jgi:uncharacterized YigZ family protein